MHTTYSSLEDERAARHASAPLRESRIVNLLEDWDHIQPLWDKFVIEHPKGSVFHTSSMVRVFQATNGHKPLALASLGSDGGITALLVGVRVQTLPRPMGRLSSRAVFYAEPLCHEIRIA